MKGFFLTFSLFSFWIYYKSNGEAFGAVVNGVMFLLFFIALRLAEHISEGGKY